MNTHIPRKPKTLASAISAGLLFSTMAFAADTSQLIGKDLDQNRDLVATVMQGRNYTIQIDEQGKIKQVIDTGANGDGTDPLAIAGTSSATPSSAGAMAELPVNYQGQHAIDILGADLPKVASNHGLTPEKFKEMLTQDETMRVDGNGRVLYVDNTTDQQNQTQAGNVVSPDNVTGTTTTTNPPVPIASKAALANAFLLHSKPGASKTIYLDFDGHIAQGTAWSASTINAPAYDLTGNPGVFDDTERSNIISMWNRVAEDYIAFDVDVTTQLPTNDALFRTSAADTNYGIRVVVTKTVFNCGCGGVAYVGVVNFVNNAYYQPAWVFQDGLANNEKYIAEAVSHEAGHNLGLQHDGQYPSTGYYAGHGTGVTGWAPIMGVGYYKNLTQWNPGSYPNANNQQDDIATFASYGILVRSDDYGNTLGTASSLINIGTATALNIQTFGVIEKSTDTDMFVISTGGGLINLTASPAAVGPNLDIKLTLYNASGAVVASNAPETTLTAAINQSVPAGTYYLAVTGSGRAAVSGDAGYSVYGSLGQYQITGSYVPAGTVLTKPPVGSISASTLSGPAPLTVNFSANNTVGNGNITSYQWSFGDNTSATGANPAHTFTTVGTYNVKLLVTNQYQLTDTKTVQVTVTAPPLPTMWVSTIGMSIVKSTNVQAKISVKLIDSNGKPVANATVVGTFSGSVAGTITSKTDATGTVIQAATTTKLIGGSATYTLNSVTAAGYTYNPTKNVRSVVTMTW
ncbi:MULTISPECIES: PKD domain-containing protein [Methylomonas]|nr:MULTISPECIES: PKD domain-containing protein [Methylomonas]TCV80179.1 reprolysin-like metallo-peptidase family M12B [Methylomonas methanica]